LHHYALQISIEGNSACSIYAQDDNTQICIARAQLALSSRKIRSGNVIGETATPDVTAALQGLGRFICEDCHSDAGDVERVLSFAELLLGQKYDSLDWCVKKC
jgi:hypothetical protein